MTGEILRLRRKLHEIPEKALHEVRTKSMLIDWLKSETKAEVVDCGLWFYCVFKANSTEPPIALRADFDAVEGKNRQCGHFCGHDGHAAILCGVASELSNRKIGRTVYLIFQPAEETGQGATLCAGLIREKNIAEIYGLHNIPGYTEGTVLLRRGTFACASTGLEITVTGTPAHAAYPEAGKNPAGVIADLIRKADNYCKEPHDGIQLITVIGIELGSAAYGVSASKGILRFTVRGEYGKEFNALVERLCNDAEMLSSMEDMQCEIREIERFPATENSDECVEVVRRTAESLKADIAELSEPMRWSEDFGTYLLNCKGAFFGIGAGKEHPQLHTEEYEFNDSILDTAIDMFVRICVRD